MPYKPGTRPAAPIGACGHPTWRINKQCRSCYLAETRKTIRHCADCGKSLPRRGNDGAERCRECWMAQHRSPYTLCQVPACKQPHFGKGFCQKHYFREWQAANGPRMSASKRTLATRPCQVCGYDKLRSRIHRREREKGYTLGNMVPVCSRCHDEIHYSLIPCPEPITRL